VPSRGSVACASDPGDQDVVGVVDEVVPSECVDEVALAAQMRGGDGHELAVAGRRRHSPSPGHETLPVGREERRRNQDHRIVAGA
jgi:hypothetical protein